MADSQTPTLGDPREQVIATDPISYVEWVHFGDPGWQAAQPPSGAVTVAWALYFDGVRVPRERGEVRSQGGAYLDESLPGDPWWMRAKEYRTRLASWQATGGAYDGTVVSFWADADAVEIVEEETTRFRVRVYGRDVLAPLGYPTPAPPADKRYPVQVHMLVNRFTVGPLLGAGA